MTVLSRAAEHNVGPDGWPQYLYKYKALRTENDLKRLEEILDGTLYAAHKSEFNDPFDCSPVLQVQHKRGVIREHIKGIVNRNMEGSNRRSRRLLLKAARHRVRHIGAEGVSRSALEQTYDDAGLICLTTEPNQMLMWGHYASDHKGVCIRFNLKDGSSDFRCAFPVTYSEERPVLVYPITDAEELIEKSFLTKAKCWEYESEWRIIQRDGPGAKTFNHIWLDGLIVGARTPDAYVDHIVSHLAKRRDRIVELFRAKLNDRAYQIDMEPFYA